MHPLGGPWVTEKIHDAAVNRRVHRQAGLLAHLAQDAGRRVLTRFKLAADADPLVVLLQMRCAAKDSYPGCYDISSAGHIPAGAEFVGSALRELREELGVTAAPADLHECGLRRFRFEAEFHGKPFKDNQVSKVFCLWLNREAEDFAVQKSEIDYVKWFDLDEAVAAVEQGTIPNCIFPEELGMVKKFVGQTGGGC